MHTLYRGVIGMCIVPVRLPHRDTSKQVLVYAMLDECSQGTFIKEEILDMFDIEKGNTSITVITLNGEETYNSHAVDGFSIQCSLKHERLYPLPPPPPPPPPPSHATPIFLLYLVANIFPLMRMMALMQKLFHNGNISRKLEIPFLMERIYQ